MNGLLTRFELDGDREGDDGLLYAEGRGRAGENRPDILNLQNYGLATRPPVGSIGNKLAMGSQNSTPLLFGLEHPRYRPKLKTGQVACYDQFGNIIKLMNEGVLFDFQNRTVEMMGAQWNIKGNVAIDGNVTISGNLEVAGTAKADGGHI